MIQSNRIVRVRVAGAAAIAFAAAACGGGGGGGSPPPPPSRPSAVTASATVNVSSVQEGQPFTLDASASSTTNGSALAYSWSQVSGPAVTIANPNSAALTLNAAEVAADTAAQFRVNVTAGASSAAAVVNVTFSNIAQTPVYNNGAQVLATATFSAPVRKLQGDFYYTMAGVADGPSDPLTFLDFTISLSQVNIAPSQFGILPQPAIMKASHLRVPVSPGPLAPQFTVLEEGADRLRVFVRGAFSSPTPAIFLGADLSITRPCAFHHGTVRNGYGLYVGQRTGFSTIYGGGSTPVVDRTITRGKPFCALLAQAVTISGVSAAYNNVVALDTDANVLNLFEPDSAAETANYLLTKQVPVQLNASKPLSLAAWTEFDNFGSSLMALVFTDGVHNGEHRLVIVNLDVAKNVVQQTYSLGLGVPVVVLMSNLDGDYFHPEIVIVKSTSPQAEVFVPTAPNGNISAFSPRYLEIGLGAAAAIHAGLPPVSGIFVAFPEKRQVKVITAAP